MIHIIKAKQELETIIKKFAKDYNMNENEVRKWAIAELKYILKFKQTP